MEFERAQLVPFTVSIKVEMQICAIQEFREVFRTGVYASIAVAVRGRRERGRGAAGAESVCWVALPQRGGGAPTVLLGRLGGIAENPTVLYLREMKPPVG